MTLKLDVDLISTKEAARLLGFSPATLRNSRWTGMLAGVPAPAFLKLGAKSVRYQRTALTEWIEQFSGCTSTAHHAARISAA